MKPMKTMMLASVSALLTLAGCGGGGGGMVPAMPEAPPVAPAPMVKAEPEAEAEEVPAVAPEPAPIPAVVLPDPATVLEGHERLSLPGYKAVQLDEAAYLLANMPYSAQQGGGGTGLTAASRYLQQAAVDLHVAQRSADYAGNHAEIYGQYGEEVR